MGWFDKFFKDDEKTTIAYFDNGQKKEEIEYKNGKRNGLEIIWYENGRKRYESEWKNGQLNGLKISWYENGQKFGEVN